jgi:hypothetical protein
LRSFPGEQLVESEKSSERKSLLKQIKVSLAQRYLAEKK